MNAVSLPWPDPALSPNGRVHYMVRHKAVNKYRQTASYYGNGARTLAKPVCAILPLVATRRRRDLDNVLASLKSALDGLTDAGWWNDDHDIVGYHMVPEVHSKLWTENKVVILACEEDELPHMQSAVKRFRDSVAAGAAHGALADLLRDVEELR
jgi:Holliday junction resolvase RusA-like endonuclease